MKQEIECPNCKSKFDITKYLDHLKDKFIIDLGELVETMKKDLKK